LKARRFTDVEKETWLIRNPQKEDQWVEIPAFSIPHTDGFVDWESAIAYGKVQ